MGEIVLMASGKGGVGKSAVAVNMAAMLAKTGNRVMLIDMNMGQGNLDLYLGLQDKTVYNVYDILTGLCRVQQGMIRDTRFPCMYLMAAPPFAEEGEVAQEKIAHLYEILKLSFDYVIIDAPGGVGPAMTKAAQGADSAIVVTTGDYAGIRGAEVAEMTLRKTGIQNISYLLNRVKPVHTPEYGYPSFEDIGRTLRGRVIGIIQEDDRIAASLNQGLPLVLDDQSILTDNMKRIVIRVLR